MPEPEVKKEVVPELDAFGQPIKKEGEEGGESSGAGEGAGGEGGEGVKEKLTPTQQVAELSRKLGEYTEKEKTWGETNKSKDENIRAMKEAIKSLESRIKGKGDGEKGGGGEGEVEALFKEIKTSKDLTAEQKEEMTDTEIKQMDEIAALKTGMNNLATLIKKGQNPEKGQVDIQSTVKDSAKELAAGNKELANLIIESVKKFNLEGLTEDEIVMRVGEAAKLVPTYKPPKEQPTGKDGKPAGGGGSDTDAFGVDKIVEEVFAKKENTGFSL